MSGFEPGLYIFHPVDAPEGNNIALGPVPIPFPPPDVPVRVLRSIQRWLVTNSANGTFNVFAGRGNPTDYKWIVKFDALYASAVSPPGDFTITSAGEGVWNIGIPNEDSLLTFDDGSLPQLTFRPANGSSAQRFQALRIPREIKEGK